MRRVVIVYNPRSSKAERVRREVIVPAQKVPGLMVGKYSVLRTNVDDNAKRLAGILQDGDTVLAVGGDATATIALNGVMMSEKEVEFGALPYGNFNDVAVALRGHEGERWYPLEVKVNGAHWRYVGCYFSVGMFAESTVIFNEKGERAKLRRRNGGIVHSMSQLAKWYFKHKQNNFLPEMMVNGRKTLEGVSDYLAVNSRAVARIMRGGDYGLDKQMFWSVSDRLTSFWRLMGFMGKSCVDHIPGEQTKGDKIEVIGDTKIMLQAEGESMWLEGVKTIEISKAKAGIKIAEKVW